MHLLYMNIFRMFSIFDCTENCIGCNNNNCKQSTEYKSCNNCKNSNSKKSKNCNNCITKNTSKIYNNCITRFRVSQSSFFKDMELKEFEEYLKKNRINILNIIKEDKNKLLIYASESGNIDIVQYLCDNGADINTVNEDGQSLLSIAIINKKKIKKVLVFIKKLLELGINIDIQDYEGNSALMKAIEDIVDKRNKILIKDSEDSNNNEDSNNEYSNNENSSLMKDVEDYNNENSALMKDVKDYNNNNVLIKSAEDGKDINFLIIILLIKKKANVNLKNIKGNSALVKVVKRRCNYIIKYLIMNGADINVKIKNFSLLKYAIIYDYIDLIYILKDKANMNEQDEYGSSLLMIAIMNRTNTNTRKFYFFMNTLLNYGVNINIQDNNGRSVLFTVINKMIYTSYYNIDTYKNNIRYNLDDINLIKYLLYHGADVNLKDKNEKTVLMRSILHRKHYIDYVKILVENGADLNSQDKNGRTVLMDTVSSEKFTIMTYLLENNVDINLRDNYGETVLMHAIKKNKFHIIKYLVDKGVDINLGNKKGSTPLILAMRIKNLDVIKYLIDHGANVNLRYKKTGKTLLIDAINLKNISIVELFIEKGSDINNQDINGETPLMYAIKRQNLEIIEYLLKGSNTDLIDINKRTALMYAVETQNLDIIRYFIKYLKDYQEEGSVINFQDNNGKTALMYAAKMQNLDIINYLLKKGANINLQNKDGDTELMMIFDSKIIDHKNSKKELAIVKILLNKGLNIDLQNNKKETALMKAVNRKNLDKYEYHNVIKTLLFMTPNLNLQDKNGETALMKAVDNENFIIVKELVDYSLKILEINSRTIKKKNNITMESMKKRLINGVSNDNFTQKLKNYHINSVNEYTDINIQNDLGETALIKAIRKKNTPIIKYLIINGANVNLKDKTGKTALSIAKEINNKNIINFLTD